MSALGIDNLDNPQDNSTEKTGKPGKISQTKGGKEGHPISTGMNTAACTICPHKSRHDQLLELYHLFVEQYRWRRDSLDNLKSRVPLWMPLIFNDTYLFSVQFFQPTSNSSTNLRNESIDKSIEGCESIYKEYIQQLIVSECSYNNIYIKRMESHTCS